MATHDVPGANPANADTLHVGCWAEDDRGTSLLFVAGVEGDNVVYQLYDLTNGMFYQDAMPRAAFEREFGYGPGRGARTGHIRWTWHDKKSFPWDRVSARFNRPAPMHADVEEQLTAAARVARALNLRGRRIREADVEARVETQGERSGFRIMRRLSRALEAFRAPE